MISILEVLLADNSGLMVPRGRTGGHLLQPPLHCHRHYHHHTTGSLIYFREFSYLLNKTEKSLTCHFR